MEFSNGVELNGEVYRIVIHIWSITCGTEKLIEHKNFLQSTLFWWLDYVSWWHKSMLFIGSGESFNELNAKVLCLCWKYWKSSEYSWLFLEITRILNHLLAVQLMQWTSVLWHHFWAFEEREKLMNFMNVFRSSYAYAYIRPGGVAYDAYRIITGYANFLTPLQES